MREYAPIYVRIWEETSWRALSPAAQHLYLLLVTDPALSRCGVADWRPKRISAKAAGLTAAAVEAAGRQLAEARYVVIDEATEEVLVRAFVRRDGILRQPKMAPVVERALAEVASASIRDVVFAEIARTYSENPDWPSWTSRVVGYSGLLARALAVHPVTVPDTQSDTQSERVSGTVSDTPPDTPSDRGADTHPDRGWEKGVGSKGVGSTSSVVPFASQQAAPPKPKRSDRGNRLPAAWTPPTQAVEQAREKYPSLDIDRQTTRFCNHFHAAAGQNARKVDWTRAWWNWLDKESEQSDQRQRSSGSSPWDRPAATR